MIGYPEGSKGYKLWRLGDVTPKVIVSRDVTFQEDVYYKDVLKGDKGKEADNADKSYQNQGLQVEVESNDNLAGQTPLESESDHSDFTSNGNAEGSDGQGYSMPYSTSLAKNRARREIRLPERYRTNNEDLSAFVFMTAESEDNNEPFSFDDAISSVNKKKWMQAMQEEMDSLYKNETWILVDKPEGQKVVPCKWLYKLKDGIPGAEMPRYKARLVAKGFR